MYTLHRTKTSLYGDTSNRRVGQESFCGTQMAPLATVQSQEVAMIEGTMAGDA